MGYMGFGLQKWIYTMRPRKPFSSHRRETCTSIPRYSRDFKLQPSKNKGTLNLGIVLLAVLSTIVISNATKWSAYENKLYKSQLEYRRLQDEKAFTFLFNSGIYRLKKNNIEGAYSEFKLAQKIYPRDNELKQLLLETLILLCQKDTKYCQELDDLEF